jgi:hypothetical protein
MIQFRCWYCNRRYSVADNRAGDRLTCGCQRKVRVPAHSGGNSRVRTAVDWLVETVVYGGGGALLGFGLAILLLAKLRYLAPVLDGWTAILVLTAVGFLAGFLGGERGVNWVGGMIRAREDP